MSESTGLLESLKRLVSTLLAIIQTRLELLSNEIEEERLRVGQIFLYGCIALFFFGLSIMLLTAFIVMLFWDNHLLVLGILALLYLIGGLVAWFAARRVAQKRFVLFSASLDELSEDRDWLAPRL
jgi:uncharacterized membrane protein YqjE